MAMCNNNSNTIYKIYYSITFKATIIPIRKPGKDQSNPQNYRPIALTSCLCKTLERMINDRLVWILESNNLLTNIQSGFRHNRTTTDYLIKLEHFIREGFIRNEHVVAIFFDLEKAYDTTWKHGTLKDLHKMGLRGRLPPFYQQLPTKQKALGMALNCIRLLWCRWLLWIYPLDLLVNRA